MHQKATNPKWLLVAVALVLSIAGSTGCRSDAGQGREADTTDPQSPALLPVSLDVDVTLDYENGRVDGLANWTLENVGDAPIGRVPVQVGRLMQVSAIRADDVSLTYDQDVVTYADWPELQVNQAWAVLDEPLAPGARIHVAIDYGGTLVPYTETGMRYVRDHVDRDFTILRSESFGFPQIQVASWGASRVMPGGKFDCTLRVTVPGDLVVATGMPRTDVVSRDSLSTWSFRSDAPVPFVVAAIAPYEVLVDGDLRVYHFAEDAEGAGTLMSAMRGALATYERWFGDPDAPLRLHVIEIPDGWGSQADLHAGIIQTAAAFRDPSQLYQLYHELAHLWHPMDVDVSPPRWNEGLATFLAYRMATERGESPPLENAFARLAERQVTSFENSASADSLAMVDYGSADATDLSYGTGALMFYALYRTLGRDTFDRALAAWFRDYRGSGSTTAQFVEAMEQEAEGRDLEPVFRDWLETARWYERLSGGEDLATLIESYRSE